MTGTEHIRRSAHARVLWTSGLVAGAVVAATLLPTQAGGSDRSGADGLKQASTAAPPKLPRRPR